MTNAITILTALSGQPMTKQITAGGKKSPRMSKWFTAHCRSFNSIFDLCNILCEIETDPFSFVIRGELIPGYNTSQPVRRLKYCDDGEGPFFRDVAARWVCFDFDRIERPDNIDAGSNPDVAISYLRNLLPSEFHNVTCCYQWSSGAGLGGWAQLRAHLWFMIDKDVTNDHLREWVYDYELPVDPSLFNTVQPHFTARPIFSGVIDPIKIRTNILLGIYNVANIEIKTNVDHDAAAMRRSAVWPGVAESVGT